MEVKPTSSGLSLQRNRRARRGGRSDAHFTLIHSNYWQQRVRHGRCPSSQRRCTLRRATSKKSARRRRVRCAALLTAAFRHLSRLPLASKTAVEDDEDEEMEDDVVEKSETGRASDLYLDTVSSFRLCNTLC